MDKQTIDYRLAQLARLKNSDGYPIAIKIYGSLDGATNCLSISIKEFVKIRKILTGK